MVKFVLVLFQSMVIQKKLKKLKIVPMDMQRMLFYLKKLINKLFIEIFYHSIVKIIYNII